MSKNRRKRSTIKSGGGFTTPPRPPLSRPAPSRSLSFFNPFRPPTRSTSLRSRPSVLQNPQYAPLMRTGFTDTTFSRRRSRRPVVSTLKRRPSPDLPNAALARSNPWNTYTDKAWPVLSDQIPLQRAVTCARRGIRREVLFALNQTNGSGSRDKPKSKVRCS